MTFTVEIEQEKDGRWIAEIPQLPGTMAYGRTARRPCRASKRWRYVFLLSASSMVNLRQSSKKSFRLQLHEPMGLCEGSQGFGGVAAHRLDNQSALGGLAARIEFSPGWPDVVFAFHDAEEIGPRMLARVAKRTGLTPGDL